MSATVLCSPRSSAGVLETWWRRRRSPVHFQTVAPLSGPRRPQGRSSSNPNGPANRLISADSRTRRGLAADGSDARHHCRSTHTGRFAFQIRSGRGRVECSSTEAAALLSRMSMTRSTYWLSRSATASSAWLSRSTFLGLALCFLAAPDERPDALGDPALEPTHAKASELVALRVNQQAVFGTSRPCPPATSRRPSPLASDT